MQLLVPIKLEGLLACVYSLHYLMDLQFLLIRHVQVLTHERLVLQWGVFKD